MFEFLLVLDGWRWKVVKAGALGTMPPELLGKAVPVSRELLEDWGFEVPAA